MGAQVQQATQANVDQQSDAGKQAEKEAFQREREHEEVRGVPGHLPPETHHHVGDFDIEPAEAPFRLEPPPGRPAQDVLQRSVDELPETEGAQNDHPDYRPARSVLQRQADNSGDSGGAAQNSDSKAADKLRALASGNGRPLNDAVRTKMESAFGQSFADVRVHEGEAAPSIGATAYTQGSNIHFAPGRYQPSSQSGQELLGHELTHVVQQRAGRVSVPQGHGLPINSQDHLEKEADDLGAKAARGEMVQVSGASGGQAARLAAIQAKFSKRVVKSHLDAAAKGLQESGQAEQLPEEAEQLSAKKKKALKAEKENETKELLEGHLDAALKNIRGGAGGSGGSNGKEGDEKKKDKSDMATKGVAAAGMAASMFGPIGMVVGMGLMAGAGAFKLGKKFRDYGRKKRARSDKKKAKLKDHKPGWMDRNIWSKFANQDTLDKKKKAKEKALQSEDEDELEDDLPEEQVAAPKNELDESED